MNSIIPLHSAELTLDATRCDWRDAHLAAIKTYWASALSNNPRLWNGPFFMFRNVAVQDGVLHATAYNTDFATFLYWRDHGRDPSLVHITGTSMPVLADDTLLAVRMAGHTANSGQIYFPAGSLDPLDLRGNSFDVTANIRRELSEETGLDPSMSDFDGKYLGAFFDGAWHLARRCRLPIKFEEAVERVRLHQAVTGDDELSGVVAICTPEDAEQLKPYARALALWHFENPDF